MSSRLRCRVGAAIVAAMLSGAAAVHAQVRFDAPRRESVPAIPGLEIVTIRDSTLNACYTLFIMEPAAQWPPTRSTDSPSIQDLARERDRLLAALNAEYEHSQYSVTPGFPIPNPLKYAWEGNKVQSEYERKVRDKEVTRLELQLAEMVRAPRLAVSGPVLCAPPPASSSAPPR